MERIEVIKNVAGCAMLALVKIVKKCRRKTRNQRS